MTSGKEGAPQTGTTIMAVVYDGGVVLGADSRVSTGTYVSNRASDKIAELTDKVYLCRSGSAADTQAVADYVRHYAAQHEFELNREPAVKTIATLVQQINYSNKHLVAAMVVAGFDAREGGQVYGVPIGGSLVRQQWAIDGSGSSYIWGLCDATYKDNMTREQAEQWVLEMITAAFARDGSSGGLVRLVTINKEGVHRRVVQGPHLPHSLGELERAEGLDKAYVVGH